MMEGKSIAVSETKMRSSKMSKLFLDIMFVVVLPALCFVVDPILFSGAIDGKPAFSEPLQFATYSAVIILVIIFFASFLNMRLRSLRLIIMGSLLAGASLAFAIGLFLLPLTLIGLFLVIGVFGLIPFFTGLRFWKRYKAFKPRERMQLDDLMIVIIGFLIPFLPCYFVYKHGSSVHSQIMSELTGSDQFQLRASMMKINQTIFCTTFCAYEVIENFGNGKINLPENEFAALLLKSSGIKYREFINSQIND
jgi:hypothetical protein